MSLRAMRSELERFLVRDLSVEMDNVAQRWSRRWTTFTVRDMESFAGELRNSVVPFAFRDIFLFLVAKLQGCHSGVFRPQPICLYLALTLRLYTALPGNKHLLSAGSGEDVSRGLGYLNHVLEGRALHACEKVEGEKVEEGG